MSNVVVVESPAKAKTINKYLGQDFTVVASYGHIRDLPAKDGSVRPDDDFAMDWTVDDRSEKHVQEIARAVKKADSLYLATDPDREGEAISWHVLAVLNDRGALQDTPVKRVVFNEITKSAVTHAIANPRDIDNHLVEAYLARRALDYLVGFTLSPVLWRKLPGSKSAGRVQSVALRLVCEREAEIEAFRPQEYWTVDAALTTEGNAGFNARLTHLDGKKLDKFGLPDETTANEAAGAVRARAFHVGKVERKKTSRNPPPPFMTSTLQQEASNKLHMSASRTMQVAQRLYEGVEMGGESVGLITYMRTDGVNMAEEAITACRQLIGDAWGKDYLPGKARRYQTRAKNAQEAHEAIRPTDVTRRPEAVAPYLDNQQYRLYELIWKRTIACQMAAAVLNQVAVNAVSEDRQVTLRATGSTVAFDGFLTLYRETSDDSDDEEERRLPPMEEGQALRLGTVTPDQHFTQPPPRYTEASLVRKLEELGIGRPSTYASILSVLQERGYVRLEKRRFVPEDRGRLVTAFLTSFFERYVEYGFTADLENQLDEISAGQADWKAVLRAFWEDFHKTVEETRGLRIADVLEALDRDLGPHFFPDEESRTCPSCSDGRLSLKLGRFGAFIGCSNYPDCRYTRPLTAGEGDDEGGGQPLEGPRELGTDPETGLAVTLRKGPYGPYLQLGEEQPAESGGKGKKKAKASKPKRVSLPRAMDPMNVDLDTALKLLALPREVGRHPETGEPILAGIGRYGPYIHHNGRYKSLRGEDDVLTIGENRAITLLAEDEPRHLGEHPANGQPVVVKKGRFGPYIECNGVRANLRKNEDPAELTLDDAVARVDAKAEKQAAGESGKSGKSGKGGSKSGGGKGGSKSGGTSTSTSTSKKGAGKSTGNKGGGRRAAAKGTEEESG